MPNVYYRGQQVRLEAYTGTGATELARAAAEGATTITVRDASAYAAADVLRVASRSGPDRDETVTVSGSPVGRVVTLAAGLAYAHPADTEVFELAAGTIVLQVRTPAGAITTPVLTVASTGRYYYDLTLDASGEWGYRFAGSVTVVAAAWRPITVLDDPFD